VKTIEDAVIHLNGVWPEQYKEYCYITYGGKLDFVTDSETFVKTPTIAKFSKKEFEEKAASMINQENLMNFKLRIQIGLLNTQAIISCDNKAVIDDIASCGFSDWAIYSEFDLLRLSEGLYDIEGTVKYVDGFLEYGGLKVKEVVDQQEITVKDAIQKLKREMKEEKKYKPYMATLAASFHYKIAMNIYYSFTDEVSDKSTLHIKSNEAASAFMKKFFDIDIRP